MNLQTDIVIVGAGPAGIATAIAAAQRGFSSIVADGRIPPLDKPCGEGLLPHGVKALRALGIHLTGDLALPFTGIQFIDDVSTACADFSGTSGYAIRRVRLHKLLMEQAASMGVAFLWGTPVSNFGANSVTCGNTGISYKWMVGADGQNSNVRKWADLDSGRVGGRRFGFRRHFRIRPWSSVVEVHWGDDCQLVVTPTSEEEVGVAVFSKDPRFRLGDALPLFSDVVEKLRDAEYASAESGDVTSITRYPAVTRGCVALVGDASGSVDALSGHGLSLSFSQALHLAEAFHRDDLSFYESAHPRISLLPSIMSRLLLVMDSHPRLRRKTLHLFENSPALFSALLSLSVHRGQLPFSSPDSAEIAGFARSYLRA